MALLEVENLQTHFRTPDGVNRAVDGVSFHVEAGETLAIVGESGCGKSVTAMSILRLIPEPPGKIAGAIRFQGTDLLTLSDREMREMRGNDISMIFQEPMTSLNPVLTVGRQIGETLRLHQGLDTQAAEAAPIEMLRLVGIPEPKRRVREYPHQLSGGMRQRVMIAIALACNPKLLIADEPTTALDVTIQAQILDLMRDLKNRVGAAIMLITHDLGVVAEMAERVMVMYAGRKVEEAPVARDLPHPAPPLHARPARRRAEARLLADGRPRPGWPRFRALVPSLKQRIAGCVFAGRCATATELCRQVAPALGEQGAAAIWRPATTRPRRRWPHEHAAARGQQPEEALSPARRPVPRRKGRVYAVDGVSFDIDTRRDAGAGRRVRLRQVHGRPRHPAPVRHHRGPGDARRQAHRRSLRGALRPLRRRVQVVFQDPFSSLNPRMRVRDILAEPIRNFGLAKSPPISRRAYRS